MLRIAISQSNYIPWKGYFDLINSVDEFVLYDDVQFTKRDWRNRNLVKTPDGLRWLTIPVETKGRFSQTIRETKISDPDWALRHWRTIAHSYSRAPHFEEQRAWAEDLYLSCQETHLSRINHRFLAAICARLGIRTRLRWSDEFELVAGKSERLVGICRQAGATVYRSGPAARAYLDEALFAQAGIELHWMDYDGYPPHRQLYGGFESAVSILDLLFNEGSNAPRFMKSFAAPPEPMA